MSSSVPGVLPSSEPGGTLREETVAVFVPQDSDPSERGSSAFILPDEKRVVALQGRTLVLPCRVWTSGTKKVRTRTLDACTALQRCSEEDAFLLSPAGLPMFGISVG